MASQYKIKKTGDSFILYDAGLITEPTAQLFDVDYHTNNANQQNNSVLSSEAGIGRARVVYFLRDNVTMVLKHYYRGGAVAALLKDRYFGFNIENTRAFKEWRLLKKMHGLELPVPEAVAAHVNRRLFFYQADLITRKIENSRTLSDILSTECFDAGQWKKIGTCIKLFHQHDIYHADLNARNILLNEVGHVYLIDFDNSYIRRGSKSWKMANLARLKRSLLKFKKNESVFHFEEQDWSDLLAGYRGAVEKLQSI